MASFPASSIGAFFPAFVIARSLDVLNLFAELLDLDAQLHTQPCQLGII
jgi:hypothetical protein